MGEKLSPLIKRENEMKKLISVISVFLFCSIALGQSVQNKTTDNFVPKTLFAGTEMSARSATTSMDDTTRAFTCRGYQAVYVGLESAANDTVKAYLSYQISKDGSTYNAFTLFDSLSTSGTVGVANYIQLPAKCMGAYDVRVRVFGNALNGIVSLNPAPTVTTYVVRVLAGNSKVK
jgi:hypothetical protein